MKQVRIFIRVTLQNEDSPYNILASNEAKIIIGHDSLQQRPVENAVAVLAVEAFRSSVERALAKEEEEGQAKKEASAREKEKEAITDLPF